MNVCAATFLQKGQGSGTLFCKENFPSSSATSFLQEMKKMSLIFMDSMEKHFLVGEGRKKNPWKSRVCRSSFLQMLHKHDLSLKVA